MTETPVQNQTQRLAARAVENVGVSGNVMWRCGDGGVEMWGCGG